MVLILVEPSYSRSVWCLNLLDGLTSEFKQKRVPFRQIASLDEADADDRYIYLIGSDNAWVRAALTACNRLGVYPILLCNQAYHTFDADYSTVCSDVINSMRRLVELLRVHNYGAAWSSFSGMRWLLIVVTAAVMAVLAVLLLRRMVRHPLGVTALVLILGGGVGNLIDRIRLGYVVDMFHFQFWPSYPVFNVADIFVVAGVILFLLYYLFLYEKTDGKKNRSKPDDRKGAQD